MLGAYARRYQTYTVPAALEPPDALAHHIQRSQILLRAAGAYRALTVLERRFEPVCAVEKRSTRTAPRTAPRPSYSRQDYRTRQGQVLYRSVSRAESAVRNRKPCKRRRRVTPHKRVGSPLLTPTTQGTVCAELVQCASATAQARPAGLGMLVYGCARPSCQIEPAAFRFEFSSPPSDAARGPTTGAHTMPARQRPPTCQLRRIMNVTSACALDGPN